MVSQNGYGYNYKLQQYAHTALDCYIFLAKLSGYNKCHLMSLCGHCREVSDIPVLFTSKLCKLGCREGLYNFEGKMLGRQEEGMLI